MRNPTIRLEILRTFAPCGLKSPPVEARHRGRVPRPSARRSDAADLGVGIRSGESISSVVHFLSSCAFVLIQKHQKIKHGESSGRRHQCSPSGHKRLRCFARPLRALAPLPSLLPLFSQCDPAGRRPAMCGRKQIIIVACSAPQPPPCEKCRELHRPDNLAPRAML